MRSRPISATSFDLSEIKRYLDDQHREAELGVYLEFNEEVFGAAGSRRSLDAKAFCRETGLSMAQLEELQQAQLLLPREERDPWID